MKVTNTSKTMLKYQKAKAKLIEFSVDREDYPKFPLNSNELSYSTVYIISKYVESIIDSNLDDQKTFEPYLEMASQYFDAALKSRDREEYSLDFLLSGITAYFMGDDFGSAKVLCMEIKADDNGKFAEGILIAVYKYLLENQNYGDQFSDAMARKLFRLFIDFFENNISENQIFQAIDIVRRDIYEKEDCLEIFYIDILLAVIIRASERSSKKLLPLYSNLPYEVWGDYLKQKNSIKMLWPSQQVIGECGGLAGENILVQLPTGVGKTKSIELIIRSAFLSNKAKTVVIVAPLRSLCNEISNDMESAFGESVSINQFSDVLQSDFDIGMLMEKSTAQIIICTPEKLSYVLHHERDILREIELFIFDEAHMFDDGKRGVGYEILLTEIREKVRESCQIVLLSAVMSNAKEIMEWVFGKEGVLATNKAVKTTPKSIGFSSCNRDLCYYSDNFDTEDFFIPKSINVTKLEKLKREIKDKFFPDLKDAKDIAIYYAIKLCVNGGCAIYVDRTASIRTVMQRILDLIKHNLNFQSVLENTDLIETQKIYNLMCHYYGEEYVYSKVAKYGIVPHYGQLPSGLRLSIEYAIRQEKIRFVICTTTLAQGVNIPIKYLFMTSLGTSKQGMKIRNLQNLIGRTARPGMYTEGSIIITDTYLFDQRFDWEHGGRYRWKESLGKFDYQNTEPCGSSILSLVQNFSLDYKTVVSGKKISEFIIQNCQNDQLWTKLLTSLKEWYIQKKGGERTDVIENEIALRKGVIEQLENYFCLILSDPDEQDYPFLATKVCCNTLAYTLANDEEKKVLIQIFTEISKKISGISNENIKRFALSMNGVDLSFRILEWLREKEVFDIFYTEQEWKDMLIGFFYDINEIPQIEKKQFGNLVNFWIAGKSFWEMNCDLDNEIKIPKIESICSKIISYNFNFFIGSIIDLIGNEGDEELEKDNQTVLYVLQKKVKYGVDTQTAISICEEIFQDRYLAKEIASIIGNGNINNTSILREMRMHKERIEKLLTDYPEYFITQFRNKLGKI